MLDALLYAVRDSIRSAGFGYGKAECEITGPDGQPPPRCGNWFVSIHDGRTTAGPANDNNLDEHYGFSVTLTARLGKVSIDRVGDQLVARNVPRTPLGYREGFYAKIEQLRAFLHMSWSITVLVGQSTPSANDNLVTWAPDGTTVYGFVEPARYQGPVAVSFTPQGWFDEEETEDSFGIKAELRFEKARRMQPMWTVVGVFV